MSAMACDGFSPVSMPLADIVLTRNSCRASRSVLRAPLSAHFPHPSAGVRLLPPLLFLFKYRKIGPSMPSMPSKCTQLLVFLTAPAFHLPSRAFQITDKIPMIRQRACNRCGKMARWPLTSVNRSEPGQPYFRRTLLAMRRASVPRRRKICREGPAKSVDVSTGRPGRPPYVNRVNPGA